MPFEYGVEAVCRIGALLRAEEAHLNDMADNYFQRLAVLFVHGEQEERKHGDDHADRRAAVADLRFKQEKQRNADCHASAEAYELALGQVQHDFGFDCVHVFGDWNICHQRSASLLFTAVSFTGARLFAARSFSSTDGFSFAKS